MLDKTDAQAFLRQHFDMDVEDDDVFVVMYMLGGLAQNNLRESNQLIGSEIAAKIISHSNGVLEKAHGSIVKVGKDVESTRDAMKATIHAVEKAELLNGLLDEKTAAMSAMLDAKLDALDEKMAALDERLDTTAALAERMTRMADKAEQAVVALTKGLLKIQPKSIWKGK